MSERQIKQTLPDGKRHRLFVYDKRRFCHKSKCHVNK